VDAETLGFGHTDGVFDHHSLTGALNLSPLGMLLVAGFFVPPACESWSRN
jgi:hypothetical protein